MSSFRSAFRRGRRFDPDGLPSWIKLATDVEAGRSRQLGGAEVPSFVDSIPDPTPEPPELAIEGERLERLAARIEAEPRPAPRSDAARLKYASYWAHWRSPDYRTPQPIVFLGLRAAWPCQGLDDFGPCPCCSHVAVMPRSHVCLWCHRSGVDGILPVVPEAERPRPYDPNVLPDDDVPKRISRAERKRLKKLKKRAPIVW